MIISEEYIIQSYKAKTYHYLQNGKIDPITNLIDCWDQILYVILSNYDVDMLQYFYGDICPVYYELNNYIELRRMPENVERSFDIKPIEADSTSGAIKLIKQYVSNNQAIAMETMYDMIPNYCWYQETKSGTHNNHFSLIVGYDKEYFYIIDSPLVFDKQRDRLYESNKSIHMIKIKYLYKALNVYRNLKSIRLVNIVKNEAIEMKLKRTVTNFKRELIGKNAIETFLEETNKEKKLDYYEIHLIYARHIMLSMVIKKMERNAWCEVLEKLAICIKNWHALKILIGRQNNLQETVFSARQKEQLFRIIISEEELMKEIEKYLFNQ